MDTKGIVAQQKSAPTPVGEKNVLESEDIYDLVRWLEANRGMRLPQLNIDDLGGAPRNEEEIRQIPFLKIKLRALEKAGLAFYISNALADRYEYLSPAFLSTFRLTEEDARKLRISEFSSRIFHPDDFRTVLEMVRDQCRKAEPNGSSSMHLVSRVNVPGRGTIWIEQWQTLFFDARRAPAFAIACFQDVTERKRAEAERDRLLDCIVHDFRSPLTLLRGYLSMLQVEASVKENPVQSRMVERLLSAADRMTRMTNDILQLEKIIHADLTPELDTLDFHEFLKSRLVDYEALLSQKEIQLSVFCPSDIGRVRIAVPMIESVLGNLLMNAGKFSHRGSQVRLTALRGVDGVIEVSVADEGVGIPAEDMGKLFVEFAKIDSLATEGEPSSGLGLAICKRAVERHGGRIWCESEPGKGTKFTFTLG